MPEWKQEINRRIESLRLEPGCKAAIVEELAQHLDDCYRELLSAGATPTEAERRTLAELGESEILQRELRRFEWRPASDRIVPGTNRRSNMIADLWFDLRYGARVLMRKPGFALVAVLTLALGIGANSAIFSIVNGVLLQPLRYPEAERLVRLSERNPNRGWTEFSASAPNLEDWRNQQSVFEQLAAYEFTTFNLTGDSEPERVAALSITPSLFPALGISPILGRNFLPEEEQTGRNRVAILSYGLWQRRFGADTKLIGQTVQLSGEKYTVLGVMPSQFQLTRRTELWVPLILDAKVYPWRADRSNHNLHVVGRLKPDVSLGQAQVAMDTLSKRLEQQYPKSNTGWGVELRTFYDWIISEEMRRSILVLFVAVGFVLLIACANVANLMLARASTRQRELSIRAALGASRTRVMRQLLAESLLLAALGGSAGALLAFWGTKFLKTSITMNIPRLDEVRLDLRVLSFTLGVSLLTGLVFGLAPAWSAARSDHNEGLKQGGRWGIGGARNRLNSALVIGEIAVALVLLVGAGLMLCSFVHLQNVTPGFAPENVLTMQLSLPAAKYGKEPLRVDFFAQLMERLRTAPGVLDAAAISEVPLSGGNWAMEVTLEGRATSTDQTRLSADARAVTPHYFRTMGIPLLYGRDFTEQDRGPFGQAPMTLIVSETFAWRFFPNENPIGKRFSPGSGNPFGTIIGVAGNVRNLSLREEAGPAFYFSYGYIGMPALAVVVRTSAPSESLASGLRAQVYSLDRDLPVYNIRSMEQILSNGAAHSRSQTLLLGLFSIMALLLAAIGTYGVMSFTVTQRTHEIGIRLALGAKGDDVLKLIVGQGMKLVAAGLVIGLAGALALTRVIRTLLFNVSPTDPMTFIAIVLVLACVALVACWIPASRATKVDPLIALRWE